MLKEGQYFTKSSHVQDVMYSFIFNNPSCILEPCVGRGDLVQYVQSKIDVKFDCYEIDNTLPFVIPKEDITFCDFLTVTSKKKYKTILCNPPYYESCKFILKCVEMLDYKGELIFIIPFSFFHSPESRHVLQKLYKKGRITHLMYPDNKNLLEGIELDIIICRFYNQSAWSHEIWYNRTSQYAYLINGYLQITSYPLSTTNIPKIKDVFDCYMGCECGYPDIFKHFHLGNVYMRNISGELSPYILAKQFPTENKHINTYLSSVKKKLKKRTDDKKWYKWKDTTNLDIMGKYEGGACIYIRLNSKTNVIAVKGYVNYFENNVMMLLPTNNKIKLKEAVQYFNSKHFVNSFRTITRYIIDPELFKNKSYKNRLN